jgi:hypothetical protein
VRYDRERDFAKEKKTKIAKKKRLVALKKRSQAFE